MPQVQYLDIPNIGSALGKLGGGFLDEMTNQYKQGRESDALQQILSEFTPDMTDEQKAQKIYGAKNIPFEQKKQVVSSLGDLNKQAKLNVQNQVRDRANEDTHAALLRADVPKEIADMYVNATPGGQTAILNKVLDEYPELFEKLSNGIEGAVNPESPVEQPPEQEVLVDEEGKPLPISEQPVPQPSQVEPEKLEDFDKGLSRKEKVNRQEKRYQVQAPLVDAIQTKIKNLESDARNFDRLDVLNQKMTAENQWTDVFYINPFSGELISPASATPEQQEWTKILSEFQSRAKDSYGSRVTNFDLQAFMKRFPSLANTADGRAQIIKQIKMINKMDSAYNKEIDNVIDKYGIRNIDIDKAKRIATKNIEDYTRRMSKEFVSYEKSAERNEKSVIEKFKKETPEGKILVRSPEGRYARIPKEKAKEYSKRAGWKIL